MFEGFQTGSSRQPAQLAALSTEIRSRQRAKPTPTGFPNAVVVIPRAKSRCISSKSPKAMPRKKRANRHKPTILGTMIALCREGGKNSARGTEKLLRARAKTATVPHVTRLE
jgi:hypothetical protein